VNRSAKAYCILSWIPLVLWIATEVYVSRFDGWGQWAAAPLLLAPLILSALFLLTGLAVRRNPGGDESSRTVVTVCTLLSGIPAILILARALIR
jgi:hypothetical protein